MFLIDGSDGITLILGLLVKTDCCEVPHLGLQFVHLRHSIVRQACGGVGSTVSALSPIFNVTIRVAAFARNEAAWVKQACVKQYYLQNQ